MTLAKGTLAGVLSLLLGTSLGTAASAGQGSAKGADSPETAEEGPDEAEAEEAPEEPTKPEGKGAKTEKGAKEEDAPGKRADVAGGEIDAPVETLPEFRLLPGILKLDLRGGGAFRGWTTTPYPALDLETTTFITWNAELRAELFGLIRLHRVSYESSGLGSPTSEGTQYDDAADTVQKAAWLLGMLGIPIFRWPDKDGYYRDWELFARVEARSFEAHATPNKAVRLVPYESNKKPSQFGGLRASRKGFTAATSLQSFAGGFVLSERGFDPGKLPMADIANAYLDSLGAYLGVMAMSYTKPYMVHIDNSYDGNYVFDAHMDAIGGMFGFWSGPRDKWPYLDVMVGFGGGNIGLTHNYDLTDVLDLEAQVGTLMVNAKAGWRYPIIERSPRLTIGVAGDFSMVSFLLQDKGDEKTICSEDGQCPSLNEDYFWSGQGEVAVSF